MRAGSSVKILLVDNYDSFTWNLAHLFGGVDGVEVDVVRNDDPRLEDGITARYDGVIVGPGPGRPAEAGRTMAVVLEAARERRPLFGVCLGLQAIGEAFGGREDFGAEKQQHGAKAARGKGRARAEDEAGTEGADSRLSGAANAPPSRKA